MEATIFVLLFAVVLSACAPVVTPTATPIPPAAAPTQDPKALGAEIDALMQEDCEAGAVKGPGRVGRNGQVILSQGYGFADRFKKTPTTPQTKFR